jgi:hypothetical protein
MRRVNWKLIAFWVALWWFVYKAPTEDPLASFRDIGSNAAHFDSFE